MFKKTDFTLQGFPEIQGTYGVPGVEIPLSIPKGYIVKSIVLGFATYPAHYIGTAGPFFKESTSSNVVEKGNIYLKQDLMVSNPLTEDHEVETGHCCIVLKPSPGLTRHQMEDKPVSKSVFILNTFQVYALSLEKIVAIVKARGYRDVGFRIVKHGEWYLTHDLHIKQHDAKKIPHVFVRMVVTRA